VILAENAGSLKFLRYFYLTNTTNPALRDESGGLVGIGHHHHLGICHLTPFFRRFLTYPASRTGLWSSENSLIFE
jgi:hypothetical protein